MPFLLERSNNIALNVSTWCARTTLTKWIVVLHMLKFLTFSSNSLFTLYFLPRFFVYQRVLVHCKSWFTWCSPWTRRVRLFRCRVWTYLLLLRHLGCEAEVILCRNRRRGKGRRWLYGGVGLTRRRILISPVGSDWLSSGSRHGWLKV